MDFTAQISAPLAKMEEELALILSSQEPVVQDINNHLLATPGKRIRPALFFLTLGLWGENADKHIPVAIALELMHTATLVHDDVVDGAQVRRGKTSVNQAWGNPTAVLMGDYLFARSFGLLTEYGNISLIKEMAALVQEMSEGEMQQEAERFCTDVDVHGYLSRIGKKTARFFMVCTRSGSIAAKVDEEEDIKALEQYGYNVGIAFQLIDDLLDIQGNERLTGKPLGGDLRQGIITMPVLRALQVSARSKELALRIASRDIDDEFIADMAGEIEKYECADFVKKCAWQYINRANEALSRVPNTAYRRTLELASRFIVERWY